MILPGEPWQWLVLGALALLFNATPVLAPPTWAMLAYFALRYDLPIVPVAIVGAVGSTAGRIVLAFASRWLGERVIPARRRADAERLAERVRNSRMLSVPTLAMFAIGPVPKSILFMIAGISRLPLTPGAIAYGIGRAGIYLATLLAASQTVTSFGDIFSMSASGALIIAGQIVSVVAVFVLLRMDLPALWARLRQVQPAALIRRMRAAHPWMVNSWPR